MTKVKKITVSNLKAVSALTADFNGCTAIVTGGNNKGKSSFLKSLPERLRGHKPELILKEGEKEGFAELELTTGEKFLWSFDEKKEKLAFFTERNIKTSLTKDICNYYFPPVFDVDTFLNSTPKKQKEVLQKLTGIDFTEIDLLYKEAYETRTWENKRLAEEKAKLQKIDPDLPAEELPTEELEKEIAGIDSHNQRVVDFKARLEEKKKMVADNENEIEELAAKIKAIQEKNNAIMVDITKGNVWLADDKNKIKLNAEELKAQLAELKAKNKEIAANNQNKKQLELVNKCDKNAKEADADVKRIEAEKLEVIKNASMPDGFGFSDEGITYNGFEFTKEQLSSSGIYIAALKLAALGLGEVKTLHFDASYLDKNSLAEIEQWAADNDLQLLIERPDFEAGEIEYQLLQETTN
jgi:predicted  nucleic acid-binding Zn-ribbon protein